MPHTFPRAAVHFVRRLRWVLTFMLTTTFPPFGASDDGASPVPPAFADAHHVLQGCYLSTLAYLARFRAAFPAERAAPLTVELKKFHGRHTIAVVSWRGCWWGRDEFFGIFALDRRVAKEPDVTRLVHRAEKVLDEHAAHVVSSSRGEWAPPPPRQLPAAERARLVRLAAELLPIPSELFWLGGAREEIPLLLFRPAPRVVCIYDPLTGTAQAETDATHGPSIARAFAAQLGYAGVTVRTDLTHRLRQPAVTAAMPSAAGLAR